MDKIINSFKNLYKGEGCAKSHLHTTALFLLPCMTAAVLSYYDNDTKSLLIAAGILFILSIFPWFMLSGYYIKFLNKRFTEDEGMPVYDRNCLIQGVKVFPLYCVWVLYVSIPCIALFCGGIFAAVMFMDWKSSMLSVLSSIFLALLLFVVFEIALIILTPFISLIFVKYAQNFEYSSDLFNPLTLFKNMKASFKDAVLVALKFVLVNIVTSFASRLVIFIVVIMLIFLRVIFAIFIPFNSNIITNSAFVIPVIILTFLLYLLSAYVNWITSLAYGDNLVKVYKKNFMTAQLKLENIGE